MSTKWAPAVLFFNKVEYLGKTNHKTPLVMRQIIQHFTDDDLYKFTMCCAVIENYPRTQVRYRFNDRNNTV